VRSNLCGGDLSLPDAVNYGGLNYFAFTSLCEKVLHAGNETNLGVLLFVIYRSAIFRNINLI
jgi:hypothetical protein